MLNAENTEKIQKILSGGMKNVEIELRFKFPNEYFTERLEEIEKLECIDSVAMIGENGRRESFYKNGTKQKSEDIKKERLFELRMNEVIKFSIARETPQPYDLSKTEFVRFKRRYVRKSKDWTTFYTKIYKTSDTKKVKFLLDGLFAGKIEFQSWELEVEIPRIDVLYQCIAETMKTWPDGYGKYFRAALVAELYHIMHRPNRTSSLKQLLNNPVALDRVRFEKINLCNFYLLDKSDGLRCVLRVSPQMMIEYTESDVRFFKTGGGNKPKYENSKSQSTNDSQASISWGDREDPYEYILDCEKIGDKYYCFDIIYSDKLVDEYDFVKRLDLLKSAVSTIGRPQVILKDIEKIDDVKMIKTFYTKKRKYDIDGLIFVEARGDYWAPVYKWKPAELLSFDFLVVPNGSGEYYLMCGIHTKSIDKVKHFPADYKELIAKFVKPGRDYIPVPFSPQILPDCYHWKMSGNNTPSTPFVAEFIFQKSKQGCFKLLRMREDKTLLINQGVYGNNFNTLEQMLIELQDPLTVDELSVPRGKKPVPKGGNENPPALPGKGNYFAHSKTQEYRAPIKFNNFVKFAVLAELAESPLVVDIASGKGQDMFLYHGIGVKLVVFVEPDPKAIIELESRKKLLGKPEHYIYTVVPAAVMKMEVINKSFEGFLVQKRSVSGADIVCNLAIHYILDKTEKYAQFAEFCKPARSVTLTFFDKENLKKTLNAGIFGDPAGKYYVKYLGEGRISVKHHFADELYEESLIDTEFLICEMEKKKFRLCRRDSFGKWLDHFGRVNEKWSAAMTAEDKQYCSLYQYLVFHKI